MTTIKVGVIGSGFIGPAHIEAIRRLGYVEVIALAENDDKRAEEMAKRLGISLAYGDYREMLKNPDIEVVHNCTPNHLHYEINKAVMMAGKHLMSEKPLAVTSKESFELVQLARSSGVVNAVHFNYRLYPLVQHLRAALQRGDFGQVRLVHGSYLQDWLLYETDFNWRMMPDVGGPSRAVADIGSHWIDTVQHVTGQEVTEVFAELATVIPVRKRLLATGTTFQTGVRENEPYEDVSITTEDYASILLRFDGGARGVLTVSQVSAGRRNCLNFEIDCGEGAVSWNQEEPHQLWIGHRNRPNEILMADPALLSPDSRGFIHYPGGHNEGWPDGVKNVMNSFYEFIRDKRDPLKEKTNFATFADGHKIMETVEAILESSQSGAWVKVRRS